MAAASFYFLSNVRSSLTTEVDSVCFVDALYYLKNLKRVFLHDSRLCCNFAAENRVKAGQLHVMEALLEVLSLHKANADISRPVAGAIRNICWHNGTAQRYSALSQQ